MNSERIKQIQEETAYPQSVSVMLALKQVWNECQQENNKEIEALTLCNLWWVTKIKRNYGSRRRN